MSVYPKTLKDQAVHLHRDKGLTTQEVADRLGCSPTSVGRWSRRRRGALQEHSQPHYTDAFRREVADAYHRRDLSTYVVARQYGVSVDSVNAWVRRFYGESAIRSYTVTEQPELPPTCDLCTIVLERSGVADEYGNVLVPNDAPDAGRCWWCRKTYGEAAG